MAALPSLLLVSLVLAAGGEPQMIRRHVHINSDSTFQSVTQIEEVRTREWTECDHQFLLMAEGEDTCTGSDDLVTMTAEADCEHAANITGMTKANPFSLNNHLVNKLPVPKGCFLNTTSNEITYNPTASDTTGMTLSGRKICMRQIYINGTADTDSASGCPSSSTAILNYDECLDAAKCAAGGEFPGLVAFKSNLTSYVRQDRPKGCFMDSTDNDKYGFNYVDSAPTDTIVGKPVCRNVIPDDNVVPSEAASDQTTTLLAGGLSKWAARWA